MSQSSIGKFIAKIPEMIYHCVPEQVYRPTLIFVFKLYFNTFFTNKIEWKEFEWKMKQDKCARLINLEFSAEFLNNLSCFSEGPFEVIKGSLKSLTLRVPKGDTDHYNVEIDSPELVLQVKPQWRRCSPEDMAASMMGSMMNSSTATDCAEHYKNLPPPSDQEKSEGPQGILGNMGGEKLSSFFDCLLMRIKVVCRNITLKVEYLPQDGLVGTGLVLEIDRLEFSDAIFEAMRKKEKEAEEKLKRSSAASTAKFTTTASKSKTSPSKSSTAAAAAAALESEKTKLDPLLGQGAENEEKKKDSDEDKLDANYKNKVIILGNVIISTLEFEHGSRTEATARLSSTVTDDIDDVEDSRHRDSDSDNVKCQKRHQSETDRNLEALLDRVKDNLDLDDSFETCVGDPEDLGGVEEIEAAGRHVVPFVRFVGDVQMNLRMRSTKAADGNMMEIDLNVDSCQMFVSPRQVQILKEFGEGLISNPDLDDPSGSSGAGGRLVGRPMTESDYQQVESDLKMEQHNLMRNLGMQEFQGWSSPPGNYTLDEELFVPLGTSSERYRYNRTGLGRRDSDLMSTSMTSLGSDYSMTASVMSTSTFATHGAAERANQKHADAKKKSEVDVTGETTNINIHVTSLILVVLHEDVMTVSSENSWKLSESVVLDMRKKSDRFFQHLIEGPPIVQDNKLNFRLANQVLDAACEASQLRFLVNKVHFNIDQKVTSLTSSNLKTSFEFSRCELSECLYNVENSTSIPNLGASTQNRTRTFSKSNFEHVTLLHFDNSLANAKEAALPNITIKLKKIGRVPSSDSAGHRSHTRSGSSHSRRNRLELEVHLTKCQLEADVTIMDRLSHLIYPQKVCVKQSDLLSSFNVDSGCQKMTGGGGGAGAERGPSSSSSSDGASTTASDNMGGLPQQQQEELDKESPVTTVEMTCSHMVVKLRFPVPDFRESLAKTPYYQKSLRRDFLLLGFHDFQVRSSMDPILTRISTDWSIEWLMMEIFYCENENFQPVALAKAGFEGRPSRDRLIMCRCNVKLLSPNNNSASQDGDEDLEAQRKPKSSYTAHDYTPEPPDGPFSATTVFRQTTTWHSKEDSMPQHKMTYPGDRKEIYKFIKSTIPSSRIQIDIQLPSLSAQLPSKHLWETLYNRINNDLLLWEPSAPRPMGAQSCYEGGKKGEGLLLEDVDLEDEEDDTEETFSLCQQEVSTINDEDSETYLAYFASDTARPSPDINDLRRRKSSGSSIGSSINTNLTAKSSSQQKNNNLPDTTRKSQTSQSSSSSKNNNKKKNNKKRKSWKNYLSIKLDISRGVVCILAPFRDSTNSNVLPALHGEFLMNFEFATFFLVHGHHGDPLLDYVSFEAQSAQLFHSDQNSTLSQPPPLKELHTQPGEHMHPTIYCAEEEMIIPGLSRGDDRHMITVCVKVQGDHETHNVKNITVAAGFNRVTLNHKMVHQPNSWVSQLMDFFTVKDYPVPGYTAKENITAMSIYFWDSGIVYNPEKLPLKCVLTVPQLTICTNLTEDSSATCLRFCTDDCALGLRKLFPAKTKESGSIGRDRKSSSAAIYSAPRIETVRLRRDYVNVMSSTLFELSLKVAADKDKASDDCPPFDMRISNHQMHIRTCPDSALALTELLKYVASYGDLAPEDELPYDPNETFKTCDSPILGQTTRRGSTSSATHSPAHQAYQNQQVPEEELIPTGVRTRTLSTPTIIKCKRFEELMRDALNGSDSEDEAEKLERIRKRTNTGRHRTTTQPSNPPGHTVHYFPGENPEEDLAQRSGQNEAAAYLPVPQVVTQELGDVRDVSYDSDDPDSEDTWEHVTLEDCLRHVSEIRQPEMEYQDAKPMYKLDAYLIVPKEKGDRLRPSESLPMPRERYALCHFNLTWMLYDGEDFTAPPPPKQDQHQKNSSLQNVSYAHSSQYRQRGHSEHSSVRCSPQPFTPSSRAYPGNVTYDRLPAASRGVIPWLERGGPKRDHDTRLDLVLKGVRFVSDVYPESSRVTNRKLFEINDFAIVDKVQKSDFNFFLNGNDSKDSPRQSFTPMLLAKLYHVRTDPKLQRTEASLKVKVLPLCARIDQDTLIFISSFYDRFSGKDDTKPPSSAPASKQNTPVHRPPVMKVTCCLGDNDCEACGQEETEEDLQKSMDEQIYGKKSGSENQDLLSTEETVNSVQENLISLMDDIQDQIQGQIGVRGGKSSSSATTERFYGSQTSINSTGSSSSVTNLTVMEDDDSPTYFRKVVITPFVRIKFEYSGKQRFSLRHGPFAALFLGLFQIQLPDLLLKRIYHRHGILGWDKLFTFVLNEWVEDIKTKQKGQLILGVGAIAQLRQIALGIRDLIVMPIEQYRKDGRIMKGLRTGAYSFSNSTLQAALELTSRFIKLIQVISETAFEILSPSTAYQLTNHPHSKRSGRRQPRRAQPKDLREGITKAVETVRTGFHETAQNLIHTAQTEHENRGISGAAGAVIRQIPPTLIQPFITLTDGMDQILTGFRCAISADAKREITEKYKRDEPEMASQNPEAAIFPSGSGGGGNNYSSSHGNVYGNYSGQRYYPHHHNRSRGDDDDNDNEDDEEGEGMSMEEYMDQTMAARGGGARGYRAPPPANNNNSGSRR